MVGSPRRFDVVLVVLDPTRGGETRKTRPCLVVSPDEMNRPLRTALVAPMTTKGQPYPSRVPCTFGGTEGQIALDQMRAVDRSHFVRRLGRIDDETQADVLARLQALFAL